MQKIFSNTKRLMFIPCIVLVLIIIPTISILGEESYIPKDPIFARRIALVSGIGTPIIFAFAGLMLNLAHPENMSMSQVILMNNMLTTLGLVAPPLGNIYAGKFHKVILITYGASNVSWLLGTIIYYRNGLTERAPSALEAILWCSAVAGRYTAGIWDWITAAETAVQRNSQRVAKPQKGFGSYFIEPAESRIGYQYSWKF